MLIPGFSFSAYLAIPVDLSLLAGGERIKASLVENVRQVSTTSHELISANATPKTYYVSGTGNDKNSGLSSTSAFRTIQKAADITNPGDTVLIMNGVYKNVPKAGSVVNIKRSGTAKAWITYKAYPGHFPKIQHNTWNGILIGSGASYIEINGLEVIGNNANVTLDYAMSQKTNKVNPLTNGNCISIDGRTNGHVHHIRILNNKVHDCGGAGISAIQADYVTVDNNVVFDNAWYSVYGCSGISMLNNWNSDNNQGYKMFITNNKTYNNRMYIPWIAVGRITDGNGIIIDSSRNNNNPNLNLAAYTGRTLVKNNLTFNNGGSGIHTFVSDHVDIVNNTAVLNNQSPEITGAQIYANTSSDVKILNNILYAFPGKDVNSNIKNQNVIYDYNIYMNSSKINVKGPHDIVADSEFLSKHPTLGKISSDWTRRDKQNPPRRTYVDPKLAGFVCGTVTYSLQGKPVKVGCSPQSLAETAQTAQTTFSDVSSNYWAAQFIQQLSQRGIIVGFPDGSFRPEEPVTRAQFAAMINKAFQKTPQRQAINFTDVPSNYWGFSAIQQAYTIDFLSGYPGNRFEPNQPIPREQVLVSLANGLKYAAGGNTERTLQYFKDASNIPSYARSPIAAATQKQIVVNYPNVKLLNPTVNATRAQVAAFIYQALVSSNQASPINSPYVVSNPSN